MTGFVSFTLTVETYEPFIYYYAQWILFVEWNIISTSQHVNEIWKCHEMTAFVAPGMRRNIKKKYNDKQKNTS